MCEVSRAARLVCLYVLKDVLHQYIYIYIYKCICLLNTSIIYIYIYVWIIGWGVARSAILFLLGVPGGGSTQLGSGSELHWPRVPMQFGGPPAGGQCNSDPDPNCIGSLAGGQCNWDPDPNCIGAPRRGPMQLGSGSQLHWTP